MSLRSAVAAIILLSTISAGHAQDFLNTDVNAMNDAFNQRMNQTMAARTTSIVQQAMQSPDCQQKYQAFLAQGGRMSYPQFAYNYAATGGFTSEGMRRFRASESVNQQKEAAAAADLRGAEAARGTAQTDYADHYFHGQDVQGQVLAGNSPWVDPTTGRTLSLGYIGPNGTTDPITGNFYMRDDSGAYHVRTPNGYWHDMSPAD